MFPGSMQCRTVSIIIENPIFNIYVIITIVLFSSCLLRVQLNANFTINYIFEYCVVYVLLTVFLFMDCLQYQLNIQSIASMHWYFNYVTLCSRSMITRGLRAKMISHKNQGIWSYDVVEASETSQNVSSHSLIDTNRLRA